MWVFGSPELSSLLGIKWWLNPMLSKDDKGNQLRCTVEKIAHVFSVICLFWLDWSDGRSDHLKNKRKENVFFFISSLFFFEKHILYILSIVFFWYLPYNRLKPAATWLHVRLDCHLRDRTQVRTSNKCACMFIFCLQKKSVLFWTWQENQGENWENFWTFIWFGNFLFAKLTKPWGPEPQIKLICAHVPVVPVVPRCGCHRCVSSFGLGGRFAWWLWSCSEHSGQRQVDRQGGACWG